MIRNFFLVSWRSLVNNKLFAGINIIGLSLGLAGCILILLYIYDETSFDKFHRKSGDIYRVGTSVYTSQEGVEHKMSISSAPVGPAMKNDIPGIEEYVRVVSRSVIIKTNNQTITERLSLCDRNFFSVFSFPLIHGQSSNSLQDINSVVLTKDKAEKIFGTTDVIGKTILIKADTSFEDFIITGVADNPPLNSSIQFGMIAPFEYHAGNKTDWVNFSLDTYLLLNHATDPTQIKTQLPALVTKYVGAKIREEEHQTNGKVSLKFFLQKITDIHLDTSLDISQAANKSNPIYSYILGGIAVFLLIISCINFINLSTGISLQRSKEIGVRKLIGSSQKQLMLQFIIESFLLSFFAFLLAIVIAQLSLPLFNELSGKQLSLQYILTDYKVAISFFALLMLTSLAAGFYPALVSSRFNPILALRSRLRLTGKNTFSKYLLITQFGLAIFLVTITIIFQLQFNLLAEKDLGYSDKNIVRVKLPFSENARQGAELFSKELQKKKGILQVTNKSEGLSIDGFETEGKRFSAAYTLIDENYLSTLQVPLLKGINLGNDFLADAQSSVIINESFANAAGWKDPIGKNIALADKKKIMTVVGMVKDYNFQSLHEKILPLVLHNGAIPQIPEEALIKISSAEIPLTLKYIEDVSKNLAPYAPYQYSFLEDENARQYDSDKKWKKIISIASLISILVSCLGLLGISNYSIVRRSKEIGVRKILGASVTEITTLISKDFLKLVLIGFLLSIPFAWYSSNIWLQNFAYKIDIKWWMFLIAGVSALLIAFLTVGLQVVKTAIANPTKSLRMD